MQKRTQNYLRIIALVLLFLISTQQALAISGIDLTQKASLTLSFCPKNSPASQVHFKLYRVAQVDEMGKYTLTNDFSSYPIALDAETIDWRNIATTLTGFVAADSIMPTYDGKTDTDGKLSFENMQLGLYLVMGDPFNANRSIYTPESFMLALPDRDVENNWSYDVTAKVKYSSRSDSEKINIEVIKVWDDNEFKERPESITVELYDGTSLVESVALNKSNNWHYTWKDVYGATVYTVKEKDVPSGYYVNIERKNDTFVVTNTKPDEPVKMPETLPQTGMLWWPVPILAAVGIICIIVGIARRKESNHEKE